ncbi:MAG: PEGA domain-containing protein [Deltaproteobacteria bacterium]|nr:PEGA domain-containing protein [Deltaproteobacteria bacterium]
MTLLLLFAGGLSWAADVKVTNSDGDPLIVYVNGKERGKTPTTLKLPDGDYLIAVKPAPFTAFELSHQLAVNNNTKGTLVFSWTYESVDFKWDGPQPEPTVEAAPADAGGGAAAAGGGAAASGGGSTAASGGTSGSTTTSGGGSTTTSSGGATTSGGSTTTSSGGSTTASGGSTTASGGSTTSSGGSTTASGGSTTASGGSTTSSGGSTTASGGSTTASGGSTTSSSGSSSSSSGSSSSGTTTASLAPVTGGIPEGVELPKPKVIGDNVRLGVAPFDASFVLAGPDGVLLDAAGGTVTLPEAGALMKAAMGDKMVEYTVKPGDVPGLPLPWGAEITVGEKTTSYFYSPATATQKVELRIDLPEPVDYPVKVTGELVASPGQVQRLVLEPSLHPAMTAFERMEDALPGKESAVKKIGIRVGAGLGVAALGGAGYFLGAVPYANAAREAETQSDYDAYARTALLGTIGAVALGGVGLGVSFTGILYASGEGGDLMGEYTEAEDAYRKAKNDTVDLFTLTGEAPVSQELLELLDDPPSN